MALHSGESWVHSAQRAPYDSEVRSPNSLYITGRTPKYHISAFCRIYHWSSSPNVHCDHRAASYPSFLAQALGWCARHPLDRHTPLLTSMTVNRVPKFALDTALWSTLTSVTIARIQFEQEGNDGICQGVFRDVRSQPGGSAHVTCHACYTLHLTHLYAGPSTAGFKVLRLKGVTYTTKRLCLGHHMAWS